MIKKYYFIVLICLILNSCGEEKEETCTITPVQEGYTILCPDGTKGTVKNGKNGPKGDQGVQGEEGKQGETGSVGPSGANGADGVDGSNGANGHSLVSKPSIVPNICTNGGTAIDVYLDLDDSLTFTVGDVYQSSVFSCNGDDGSGVAVSFLFPSDTACKVVGTNISASKHSANSNSVRLYNGTACAGTHLIELVSSSEELYWITDKEYYAIEGNNTLGITLRKVTLQ